MNIVQEVPSVNFHLWKRCNMACKFCFATFQDINQDILPAGHLRREDCITVVEHIAQAGFEKINFAGGEPTLCRWLPDVIRTAKQYGMITSIVTNGTRITSEWLKDLNDSLDWAAISIDTVDPDKLMRLGRSLRQGPISESKYLEIADTLVKFDVRLKINTVVTCETWEEDITGFIRQAKPERWKIFQVLSVSGQNDSHIDGLEITNSQFDEYVARARLVEKDGIEVVPESNEMMTGSYVMVDPAGRFFDNVAGFHSYSRPILEVGVEKALGDITVNPQRFLSRGGKYDW